MTFRARHGLLILLAALLLCASLAAEYRSLADGVTAAEAHTNPAAASSPEIQSAIRRLRYRADFETVATLIAFAAACVALGTALAAMLGKTDPAAGPSRSPWGYLLGVLLCVVAFLVLNLVGVILVPRL